MLALQTNQAVDDPFQVIPPCALRSPLREAFEAPAGQVWQHPKHEHASKGSKGPKASTNPLSLRHEALVGIEQAALHLGREESVPLFPLRAERTDR